MARRRNLEWKSDLENDINYLIDNYLTLKIKDKDILIYKIISLMYDLKSN